MVGIETMGNTVAFIFIAIGVASFAMAAIGFALHEKVSNLVALGLFAVTFIGFWDALAAL